MSDFDALTRILAARHSCRAFRPDQVDRAEIEKILSAAQRVPTWCNSQPWQVVVTSGDQTDRLREALTAEAASAPQNPDLPFPTRYSDERQERRRTCGWQLYDAVGVTKGNRAASARQMMQNFAFFGAPHVALITTATELGGYGALDCGGFITGFTLAAQSLGIATIAQAAPAGYSPFLHDWFGLGEDRMVLAVVSFGYADPDHPANSFRTARAPLAEWVTWRG